jgi:glycosyltransferase involved in cell wall biosynthesis
MLVRCLAMMRGGGETRHLAWARELVAAGVNVDIITGRPLFFGRPRYAITEAPVTVLRSPYTRDFVYRWQRHRGFGRLTMRVLRADESWFCRLAWKQILSRPDKPDIVHAHALPQAARFRQADIPVVVNLPGEPNALDVADLRSADALVADGWAAAQLPAKLGRPVARVAKGVDAQLFRPDGPSVREPLRLTGRRVVVAVSRFVPMKNIRLLVDAIAIVRQRVPNVHLLAVGDGPEHRNVAIRVAEHDLRECVTLVGSVSHANTPSYYRSGDVFALPSEFDNSPNAVLEAMACGLPIVATDSGGVRDFVADSSSGAIVPTGDARALADGLERYLANPELARQVGDRNRRKASTEFSWPESARQLREIYRTTIESRRRTASTSA